MIECSRNRLVLLLAALLSVTGGRAVQAQRPVAPTPAVAAAHAPLRILWIGNSYSYYNDLPRTITMMAMAAGEARVPSITAALVPGQFLRGHAQRAAVIEAIAEGWDYVVLQDQSLSTIEQPDSVLKYGTMLGSLAKQAGAKVLLYATWPRQSTPQTAPVIQRVYATLAASIGATVVPVGSAWMAMREESPSSVLYMEDGSHPTAVGSYVAASVFYGVLYGKSATGLPPNTFRSTLNRYQADVAPMLLPPYVLSPQEAAAAQRAANRAIGRAP